MTLREKAELYDHMLEVAKASGFDCLTAAIVAGSKWDALRPLAEDGRISSELIGIRVRNNIAAERRAAEQHGRDAEKSAREEGK